MLCGADDDGDDDHDDDFNDDNDDDHGLSNQHDRREEGWCSILVLHHRAPSALPVMGWGPRGG